MANKNTLVVTHERSGTHLVINIINYENDGNFIPIGKLPDNEQFTVENYKKFTKRNILYKTYQPNIVFKSHHQVQFVEDYMDRLFEYFNVIYVQRSAEDTLTSYYKFLNGKGYDDEGNILPIPDFPELEDWVFEKPCDVGYKYFEKYPDPHIIIEPETYVDRIKIHREWLKYEDKLLLVNYEDVLQNFKTTKQEIEDFLHKKIADKIPDINDKRFPNFGPGKGIVGSHKEKMSEELVQKINNELK